MITVKRYRKCECGADMSISVIKDDDSNITRVIWDNVYPNKYLGKEVKAAFSQHIWKNSYVSGIVYCQLCLRRRNISTFAS
jgi:hypothetical protein